MDIEPRLKIVGSVGNFYLVASFKFFIVPVLSFHLGVFKSYINSICIKKNISMIFILVYNIKLDNIMISMYCPS